MSLTNNIDKLGTAGLIVTAVFSPCCFPLFAFIATALGLGSFELFGGWSMWVFQGMVIVSLAGFAISYFRHRCWYPLLVAVPGAISIFYGYHIDESDYWLYYLYAGMAGLMVATGVNYYRNKLHGSCDTCTTMNGRTVELRSTITCPQCGHKEDEIMPTDACAYFYECVKCKTRLKPLKGDCCVYCSYGTVKCPPVQSGENCC